MPSVVSVLLPSGQGEAAGNNGGGSNGSNGHTTDTDRGSDIVMVDRPLSPTPLQDDESFRSTPLHMTPPDTPMGKWWTVCAVYRVCVW